MEQLNIDMFTFSESWLTKYIPDKMISIDGYNLVRNDRKWNNVQSSTSKRAGGVGVNIKDSYKICSTNVYLKVRSRSKFNFT